MKNKIVYSEFEHYLARPFTLFVASLWHEWYDSKKTEELFGGSIKEGLYIEYPKGVTRSYRKKGVIQEFNNLIENIGVTDQEKLKKFLARALNLNKEAQDYINKKSIKDVKTSVDFLIELALLSTIFPYFVVDGLQKRKMELPEIFELCNKLREVSYYPIFLKEVVMSLVNKELLKNGIEIKGAEDFVTYKEIVNKNLSVDKIKDRIKDHKKGKFFIYYKNGLKEDIEFVDNPQKLINEIELVGADSKILKGMPAHKGVVRGVVRLIFSNDISKIEFNDNDILVASSTNPALVPLMKKAAAFVTDEGGVMCHAAILLRELRKPCIVGTKIATKILKAGDWVEVDANNGVVKILK